MTTYLVVGIIILIALIAAAILVVGRTRNLAIQNQTLADDELTEFQRMRDEGQISEEEYLKLKRVVAEQTVRKFKDD